MTHPIVARVREMMRGSTPEEIVVEMLRLAREPSEKVQDAILIMPAWRAGIDALLREVEATSATTP